LLLPRHALHASDLRLNWMGTPVIWKSDLPVDLKAFVDGSEIRETPGVVIWSRYD